MVQFNFEAIAVTPLMELPAPTITVAAATGAYSRPFDDHLQEAARPPEPLDLSANSATTAEKQPAEERLPPPNDTVSVNTSQPETASHGDRFVVRALVELSIARHTEYPGLVVPRDPKRVGHADGDWESVS